jgi:hypothetical protein
LRSAAADVLKRDRADRAAVALRHSEAAAAALAERVDRGEIGLIGGGVRDAEFLLLDRKDDVERARFLARREGGDFDATFSVREVHVRLPPLDRLLFGG